MTQEDKDLLLKDLCARLPYGVICKSKSYKNILFNSSHISLIESEEIKPYLRPMSSITKEEKDYFDQSLDLFYAEAYNKEIYCATAMIDFFNKRHLDYRGLIPMELALEAPEGMYKDN